MELSYFSWLRNRAGISKESVSPPAEITTPRKLVDWLLQQDNKYKSLFSYLSVINISVNDQLVEDWEGHIIHQDDRVCFFPPMAGG